MIQEDYVSFETAKLLKEKGFDGQTSGVYYLDDSKRIFFDCLSSSPHVPAPTLQMAMKWLREDNGISINVITDWEWLRDPMAPKTETEYPEISKFTGYYFEIHQLEPHRLLYDSPVISKDYCETTETSIKHCLENLI